MPSSNMSGGNFPSSLLGDPPDILSYPEILHIDDVPEIKSQYVYPIRRYCLDGISAIVSIPRERPDAVSCRVGDWDGQQTQGRLEGPLAEYEERFIGTYLPRVGQLMSIARIERAQFYFSCSESEMRLVDVRIAHDHMLGPGMMFDLFAAILPVQESVLLPLDGVTEQNPMITVTDEVLDAISKRDAPFNCDMIFKPTTFKLIQREGAIHPLYARTWLEA